MAGFLFSSGRSFEVRTLNLHGLDTPMLLVLPDFDIRSFFEVRVEPLEDLTLLALLFLGRQDSSCIWWLWRYWYWHQRSGWWLQTHARGYLFVWFQSMIGFLPGGLVGVQFSFHGFDHDGKCYKKKMGVQNDQRGLIGCQKGKMHERLSTNRSSKNRNMTDEIG